jgi:uncharacterized protein
MSESISDRYRHARLQYDDGNLEAAVRELKSLCADNDAPSAVFLGWLCETGKLAGTPDPTQAEASYRIAADRGDALGQYYLGTFLFRRREVAAAIGQLERSAEQGYAPALYSLGMLRLAGRGVAPDEAEAIRCLTRAAHGGHPFAQRWIAVRALQGRAGVRGFLRGLWWFMCVPRLAFRLSSDETVDPNIL